jgi:HAD superfamily hydrolase (TIGR01509 family)
MLQAVLFDMDGTLVDTEPYWIAAEHRLVESFGGTWSEEHGEALIGRALLSSADYIREHGGVDLDPPTIVERLLDVVVRDVQGRVPWQPGVQELIADLHRHDVPCAVVTMSYQRLARPVVDALPTGSFRTVVSGDQVRHGKPHPEPYLTAAARLGVDPAHCVAIEDSPTGVASALAAGCIVVGVTHLVPIPTEGGVVVVDSLTDLDATRLDALVRDRTARRTAS